MSSRWPAWWMLSVAGGCSGGQLDVEIHGELGALELFGVPNLNDDDDSRERDFKELRANDPERTEIVVPASVVRLGKGAAEVGLELDDPEGFTRVWYDGELVLDASSTSWALPELQEPVSLMVEFGAASARAQLRLVRRDGAGEERSSSTIALNAAPLLLQHHLRPVERVWVMDVDDGDYYENQAMVGVYREVLGDMVELVDDYRHDFDVWVQDEMQLGSLTSPDGQRADYVLDSIRDGGLDRLPKALERQGIARETYGNWRDATTYDSFGNLEISPPVTVDGVRYPYGRIYYGDEGPFTIHPRVKEFLAEQRVQAPFALDTSWLCVGHVDEFVTFVPDPSSPKGFRVGIADTADGRALFESLDPDLALPRYAGEGIDFGHGRPDVRSITSDAALWALNDDVQREHLDPIKATLKRELALDESDFISFPTLFEVATFCDGGVVAMTPGMVNLVVVPTGEQTHVFLADPFVRDSERADTQDDDPLIAAMRERLPEALELHFVDNWYVYHMGMGEVHCGTNTLRTPAGAWWDDARHLLEGE